MKYFLKFIFGFLIISQTSCGQTNTHYDEKLISSETELNFNLTDKRGFKSKGFVYFVAKDKQTLVAVKENKVVWQTNIIKVCGTPKVGQPEIRYIKLQNDSINVTFGKHDFATVDVKTGKTKYFGAD